MINGCSCGGIYVPCRIGIVNEEGRLICTLCYKLTCDECSGSKTDENGNIFFYSVRTDGKLNLDRLDFYAPPEVSYGAKKQFIDTVLSMVDRYVGGDQFFTMEQIREAYKAR